MQVAGCRAEETVRLMIEEWDIATYAKIFVSIALPIVYLFQHKMTFPSPNKGGQCPPPPPSSPIDSRRQSSISDGQSSQQQQQHEPLPQQQIANLLQFAQTNYQSNPTDALSALMDALTLSTGTNTAAQHAMDRIRSELGDAVANCVAGNVQSSHHDPMQYNHLSHPLAASGRAGIGAGGETAQLSEREMTLRAMAVVQELLNDTSTILYSRGKQHILQQAMEDGSSVVCTKCGDMISRERWSQHVEYWCRSLEEEKSCDDGGEGESMQM